MPKTHCFINPPCSFQVVVKQWTVTPTEFRVYVLPPVLFSWANVTHYQETARLHHTPASIWEFFSPNSNHPHPLLLLKEHCCLLSLKLIVISLYGFSRQSRATGMEIQDLTKSSLVKICKRVRRSMWRKQ